MDAGGIHSVRPEAEITGAGPRHADPPRR